MSLSKGWTLCAYEREEEIGACIDTSVWKAIKSRTACVSVVNNIPPIKPIINEVLWQYGVSKKTHEIRKIDPSSVSTTLFLLSESACNILDKGACKEKSAKGQASCLSSCAPLVL